MLNLKERASKIFSIHRLAENFQTDTITFISHLWIVIAPLILRDLICQHQGLLLTVPISYPTDGSEVPTPNLKTRIMRSIIHTSKGRQFNG